LNPPDQALPGSAVVPDFSDDSRVVAWLGLSSFVTGEIQTVEPNSVSERLSPRHVRLRTHHAMRC
jgi:hypothetical protein